MSTNAKQDRVDSAPRRDRDEEFRLLRRYAEGDQEAFNELYERYSRSLLHYVHRCIRDWQEAEDIVHEVFIQMMKDAATFEPKAAVSTWLFRIATFMCLKRSRDRGIHSRILRREIEAGTFEKTQPEADGPEESAKQERIQALKELVDQLPDDFKRIFVLREHEGMSYAEIAEVLGIELGTVKSRLFRVREILRKGLKNRGLL